MFVIAGYVHVKKVVFAALGLEVKTNFWLVDGISAGSRRVKDGSERWPALHACYNFVTGEGSSQLVRLVDHFWMRVRNAQAVRNRLKIVKRELRNAIVESARSLDNEPVRLLSLAAGAAQGVIEVMASLRADGVKVHAILIDKDQTALDHALELAAKYGLERDIEVIKGDVPAFHKLARGYKPHVIEMCGLMDYLRTPTAELLVRKIHLNLERDGFFLTCHVHPNGERYFLKHVVDWDMLYRTPGELLDILTKGNFLSSRLVTEPHGIHSVAVAQKI